MHYTKARTKAVVVRLVRFHAFIASEHRLAYGDNPAYSLDEAMIELLQDIASLSRIPYAQVQEWADEAAIDEIR